MNNHGVVSKSIRASLAAGVLLASIGLAHPANAAAPAQSYRCLWYTVRSGDSLGHLALRYGVTVLELRRVNGLTSTRIYVGQRLCIPRRITAPAPGDGTTQPSGPWYAEFWNNTSLSGPAVLVQNHSAINFNWGFGSPDLSRVQPDNFSGRWVRNINFAGGIWRFTVRADDGFRLLVDNQTVLDFFNFVGIQERSVDLALAQGNHNIRLEFVEYSGKAQVQLTYTRLAPLPTQPAPTTDVRFNNGPWQAQYFSNPNWQGAPAYTTTHCCLRFDWQGRAPAPGVPATNWSARFNQVRYFPAGTYQFVARADDGVRVLVDGTPIIDEVREQSARTFIGQVTLTEGNHTLVVEYAQFGGQSLVSMYWDFLGSFSAQSQGNTIIFQGQSIPYFPPFNP